MSFRSDLKAMDVCDEALAWVGRKGLRRAWRECPRGSWLVWLCRHINLWTPEMDAESDRIVAPARAEYERVRAQAWAEYERVRDQEWAEYDRVRAKAWAEYQRADAQAIRDLIPFAEVLAAWERLTARGGGA